MKCKKKNKLKNKIKCFDIKRKTCPCGSGEVFYHKKVGCKYCC